MEKSLVSVVILCYMNYKYLTYALSSVFEQTYGDIEIVISNDASDDFDEIELIEFLNANRMPNIKRIIINNNERNLGTVQNFNKAIQLSNGEYIQFLAGDDMLFDQNVLTNYVRFFESCGKDTMLIHSGVKCYDVNMQNCYSESPSSEVKEFLKNASMKDLFYEKAIKGCFFPTTCCVRRELFKIIGFVGKEIRLIEDWALYLRTLRCNQKIAYMDLYTLKHRSGGICHGGENYSNNLTKRFRQDELATMKTEILPYLNSYSKREQNCLRRKYRDLIKSYRLNYELLNRDHKKKFNTILTVFSYVLKKVICKISRAAFRMFIEKFGQPSFVLITLSLCLIYSFIDFKELIGVEALWLRQIIGILSMVHLAFFLLGIIIRIINYLIWPVKYIIKRTKK